MSRNEEVIREWERNWLNPDYGTEPDDEDNERWNKADDEAEEEWIRRKYGERCSS